GQVIRKEAIQIPNHEPIKVSETSGFRCGSDGNGYILNNGKLQPLVYSDVAVACHDDNLWYKGRSLSFMDIVSLDAKEFSAAREKYGVNNDEFK
ncbi:hypothetical protein, partial [Candidatus Erwinia dacicola]